MANRREKIVMFYPYVSPASAKAVQKILQSRWVGQGAKVCEFEAAVQYMFKIPNAVAVNTNSAAIRLALAIAGVGPGDEVITTPQCCTATNHPILEQYATPVFADINYLTGNINPADIENRITKRTKAIIAVDLAGYPADLDELRAVANRHKLAFIEDASDALGAKYKNRSIGSVSRFTVFSFAAAQLITTGEGGMLCCTDKTDTEAALRRRWYGIDRKERRPTIDGYYDFDVTEAGYGYHMTNISAAMGLVHLSKLKKLLARKQEIAKFYCERLVGIPGIKLFEYRNDRTHAYQFFTIHVQRRDDFCRMMHDKQIEVSIVHNRNDIYSVFGGKRNDLPELDKYAKTNISIPIHHRLTDADINYIIRSIRAGW